MQIKIKAKTCSLKISLKEAKHLLRGELLKESFLKEGFYQIEVEVGLQSGSPAQAQADQQALVVEKGIVWKFLVAAPALEEATQSGVKDQSQLVSGDGSFVLEIDWFSKKSKN